MTSDFEYQPSPELITDKSGVVLHINDALRALLAATQECAQRQNVVDFFQSNDRNYLENEVLPQLQRNSKVQEILLYLITAHQRCVPIMLNACKGEYQHEEAYFWTLFVIGETSRLESVLLATREHANQVMQRLAERERFLHALTNAIPGPVSYWGARLALSVRQSCDIELVWQKAKRSDWIQYFGAVWCRHVRIQPASYRCRIGR